MTHHDINIDTNILNDKLPYQLVGVLIQNRETLEESFIRVRVYSTNLDECLIDAIRQVHGIVVHKGYDRQIRGTKKLSDNRVLAVWFEP